MDINNNIEKKFNCYLCKYHTNKPSDWIKHMKCEKHINQIIFSFNVINVD